MATACRAKFPLLPPYTSPPKPANTSWQLFDAKDRLKDAGGALAEARRITGVLERHIRHQDAHMARLWGDEAANMVLPGEDVGTPGELIAMLAEAAASAAAAAAASCQAAAAAAAGRHSDGTVCHACSNLVKVLAAAAADASSAAAASTAAAAVAAARRTARIRLPSDEVLELGAESFGDSEDYDTSLF